MALFEFEDGHLVPAQFGRAVANGLSTDVLDAVRAQVLEIVSRPLFPITWRDMSRLSDPSNQQPRLTALDASGQVVSVEVLEHLDSDTLIASLSRLADTAALSWSDLAREYPGDIDGFKAGWVHFRDSMPPSPAPGPRLVMVVGSIDTQVRPALDVLASSGVEVHEMSLRQMSNGRSFLEVHAVGPRLYGHSPQVLLGRTGAIPELDTVSPTPGQLPAGSPEPEESGVRVDEGAHGVTAPMDEGSGAGPVPGTRGRHAGSHAAEEPEGSLPSHSTTIPRLPADTPTRETLPTEEWGQAMDAWAQAAGVAVDAEDSGTVDRGRDDREVPVEVTDTDAGADEGVGSAGPDDAGDGTAPGPGASAVEADLAADAADAAAWSSADHRRGTSPEAPEGVPVLLRDNQAMEALGRIVGEEAPLVVRPSLDPSLQGVLTPAGRVRVDAGEFADPTEALSASGHPDLDGWEEWHLGDHLGPTLAESLDEVNAEIIREYGRAAERPRRD